MENLGVRKVVNMGIEDALAKVPEALKTEGFGVLTHIDVSQTLKSKIDVDFRPYHILGACNPALAHRALEEELELGLMLPCNVIVYRGEEGKTVVTAVDPTRTIAEATKNPRLLELANTVREKLERALGQLA